MATTNKAKAKGNQQADPSVTTAFQWLLAWAVFLAIMAILNRTRIGHAAIYYTLLLCVLFLVVTQYAWLSAALLPFKTLPPDAPDDGATEEQWQGISSTSGSATS